MLVMPIEPASRRRRLELQKKALLKKPIPKLEVFAQGYFCGSPRELLALV
jgi:hypothetical protein